MYRSPTMFRATTVKGHGPAGKHPTHVCDRCGHRQFKPLVEGLCYDCRLTDPNVWSQGRAS